MRPKWADLWAPCEQMQRDRSWRRHLTRSHTHVRHTNPHSRTLMYTKHTPPRRVSQQQLRAELKRRQRKEARDKARSQTWERFLFVTPSCEQKRHKCYTMWDTSYGHGWKIICKNLKKPPQYICYHTGAVETSSKQQQQLPVYTEWSFIFLWRLKFVMSVQYLLTLLQWFLSPLTKETLGY